MSRVLLPAVLFLSTVLSAQTVIVVPPGADVAEQNTLSSPQPISGVNALAGTGSTSRTQWVYEASNFTQLGATTPILITKLRFRANGAAASWSGCTVPNVRLDMSTSPLGYLNMVNVFDGNHGDDRLTAYDASVTVQAGTSTAATTGSAPGGTFVCEMDLLTNGTAFAYNPAIGDLVLDFMTAGITGSIAAQMPNWDMLTSTPAPALARRSFSNNNGQFVTTGTTPSTSALVIEITYLPISGIYVNYSASTHGGQSPLSVNFTALASSGAGPITSWAWDFENDGIVDSTTPNPTHVFACGSYDVRLTVGDGANTLSLLRQAFIRTDDVTPSFTWAAAPILLNAGQVQFTDTTTPPATSWAWDFDGDSIVDSTLQNPQWTFADYEPHMVKLTASRLCGAPAETTQRVVAGLQLPTTLAGGSGGATGWCNIFDLAIANPRGIELEALDLRTNTGPGTPIAVDIYLTPNTAVGVERTGDVWRLVASGTGTSAGNSSGAEVRSHITLSNPIYLAPGGYGMLIHHVSGSGQTYSGSTTQATYGNSDLTLSNPSVVSTLFNPSSGTLFSPRPWNGVLYYATSTASYESSYGYFGNGCAGALGVPSTSLLSEPRLGTTFQVQFGNLANNAAFAIWGWSRTVSALGPLPIDLSQFQMPGCWARVSTDVNVLLLGTNNTATLSLALPNWPSLLGSQFYMQALSLDPAANALGAAMSDAGAGVMGL